jgi:NAD(P)-dependent dehydrogenase (short-subunit alcohol dehydrogenase family)
VAVVDISAEHARQVSDELRSKNIEALPLVFDVTRKNQVQEMIDAIVDEWETLTIAVNNAGMCIWEKAEEMSEETWNRILRLNLDAVFLCAQAEARIMLKRGYGKIINTASMSAHIVNTPQTQCAYNASKAGVLHLTKTLAAEWASRGIRVNSISPGYTRTLLVEQLLKTPEGKAILPQWLAKIPTGRMGEVIDLQGAVVFLASEASDNMTGADLVIDGGYCLW